MCPDFKENYVKSLIMSEFGESVIFIERIE